MLNEHYVAVASDIASNQMAMGAPVVCPRPPGGCPPPTWRQCWQAALAQLRQVAASLASDMPNVDRFVRAAVAGDGACTCAGGPAPLLAAFDQMFPEPKLLGNGIKVMPAGWQPPQQLLTDPQMMRMAIARGCVSEIYSAATNIPAGGAATQVNVQPSSDCFFALQRKVVVKDTATLQVDSTLFMLREFRGDCPITCQNERAFNDFIDTDDCAWCPMPNVDIGRTNDNKQYHMDFVNTGGADLTAQVGIRGVCYENKSCWSGWASRTCGVCG